TAAPAPVSSVTPSIRTTETAGGTRTIIVPTTPVTIPIEGASSPAAEAGAGQQSGASRTQTGAAAKHMGIISDRNSERSIRCAPTPAPLSVRQPDAGASVNTRLPENDASAVLKRAETRVVATTFGALIPFSL